MRALTGMSVAITGAGSGIGRALALALAAHGSRLALCGRRAAPLQAVAAAAGGGHLVQALDVADAPALAGFLAAAADATGRLDTVVLNAGRGHFAPAHAHGLAAWRELLAVNLLGTVAGVEAVVPRLLAQPLRDGWRGQVVIISSSLARRAAPGCAAYCATKAAQLSLAEALRVELRPQRIAVTSVHPVRTLTDFFATAEAGSRQRAHAGRMPTQTAERVADAIIAAIVRPRAEVWPHRPTRWAAALAGLMPATVDRVMAGYAEATPTGSAGSGRERS
jgi:NADP-dependent 3-hydroxy acid dehydrogenase YdfG